MTTMPPETEQPAGVAQCGCCGRTRPASRLTELGSTPGVFICTSCALWAARRSTPFPVVRLDPRLVVRWVRRAGRVALHHQPRHPAAGRSVSACP
jgi:hypothetical protein